MPGSTSGTVVIAESLDTTCVKWLEDRAHVVWADPQRQSDLPEHLAHAQGLIVRTYTRVDRRLLDQAPHLKVVGRAGVGLDNIDLQACKQRGVQVVYTPDANTQAVVEFVVALILDDLRPRPSMPNATSPSLFHDLRRQHVGVEAESLTLGILGFGRIGQRLGGIAHAMGMSVWVNDLLPAAQLRQTVNYPYHLVDKPELYRRSDILSVHVDGRAENRHLINAPVLAQLKPSCLLINTSRGKVIENDALACWAKAVASSGGRAILDVHEPEPPPAAYPLYELTNVRLLPHLAARTQQALENMSWVVRDIVAVLENRPPTHPAF